MAERDEGRAEVEVDRRRDGFVDETDDRRDEDEVGAEGAWILC